MANGDRRLLHTNSDKHRPSSTGTCAMVFGIVQDSARALPGLPAGLTEMAEEKK